jgi:hypothetical protein
VPCGPCHWGFRRSSLRGHEPCERCADMEAAVPCEPCPATGAFGGAPYGATNRVTSMPTWRRRCHSNLVTGAFGGAPCVATNCERCAEMEAAVSCEPCHQGHRRSSLWSHEPRDRCADMEAAVPYEPCHQGHRRNALWGHEPCEWCAKMGAAVPCEPCHWGLRRSSLRGHEICEVCRNGGGGAMRTLPLGPSAELPMGPRTV